MVKKNFVGLTKDEFIENTHTQKPNGAKAQKRQDNKPVKVIRQTLFLPEKINRILWHHRIDTRKSISQIVTDLILKHIKKYGSLNDGN